MCVIAVCEKRRLTQGEALAMWRSNSDGAGVAWASGGLVKFRKGFMKWKDFSKFYFGSTLPLPHIVHFRISTAGGTVPELTHPFPCTKNAETMLSYAGPGPVLFQNGTLRDWAVYVTTIAKAVDKPLLGPMSDSRVLAIIKHYVPSILPDITPGKLAVLNSKGKIEFQGQFEKLHGGVRVSNKFWTVPRRAAGVNPINSVDTPRQMNWVEYQNTINRPQSLQTEWDSLGVCHGD